MKAILISEHAKSCVLMMNGDKTIIVRAGTALYKVIQKLIDRYGYADIFVYCTKYQNGFTNRLAKLKNGIWHYIKSFEDLDKILDKIDKTGFTGKVLFKFRCYKVEEVECYYDKDSEDNIYLTEELNDYDFLDKTQLKQYELDNYFSSYDDDIVGTAIHISDLEIFDKPKELNEFRHWVSYYDYSAEVHCREIEILTKAPKNWCYVEVE